MDHSTLTEAGLIDLIRFRAYRFAHTRLLHLSLSATLANFQTSFKELSPRLMVRPLTHANLLQISPPPLLFLDRHEQRLEITLAEALAALALEYLVENGRPVLDRFGKDLQQVALVVAVHQDAEAF